MTSHTHTRSTAEANDVSRSTFLSEAVEQYLAAIEAGEALEREAFLKQHGSIREELTAVLESLDFLRVATGAMPFESPGEAAGLAAKSWMIGDYEVQGPIGRGGMGIVYRAEQIPLKRPVALKVLPLVALLDDRQLKRFHNEARAAAMLKHPNIVSVYSVGCERGVHYYTMELIEGQSLAEAIKGLRAEPGTASTLFFDAPAGAPTVEVGSGPTSDTMPMAALSTQRSLNRKAFYRSVARLGIEAAQALHHAHQHGVVHRDVKPSNLLIDSAGELHITDFGLARIQAGDEFTLTGDLVGTLRYMSPEQWNAGVTDARTDVHGLGLTLYELVAGTPAIQGQSRPEIMQFAMDGSPTRLEKIDGYVPKDLATIIHKSIEKEPLDRYQHAAEIADDLQRFLDQKPIHARPASVPHRAVRWAKRNPLIATLVSLVTLLLLMLAAGSAAVAWRATLQVQRRELSIYSRDIRLAHQAAIGGNHLEAERLLKRWVFDNSTLDKDPRGFEWYYLWNLSHDPAIQQTIAYRLPVFSVGIAESTGSIAVGWMSEQVDIWNWEQLPLRQPEHRLDGHVVGVYVLKRLNQSSYIVAGDADGTVTIWDVERSQRVEEPIRVDADSDHNQVYAIGVSDDDRLLAIGVGNADQGSVHVWDRVSGRWLFRKDGFAGAVFTTFGTEEELIVVSRRDKQLQVLRPTPRVQDESDGDPSVPSPTVGYLEVASHELNGDRVDAMAISPNRERLALAIWDQKCRISRIDVIDTHRWQRTEGIPLQDGTVRCLQFSTDGQQLAVGHENGTLVIADSAQGAVLIRKRIHAGKITDAVFSKDTNQVVTGSTDGTVRVWDLTLLAEPDHTSPMLGDDFRSIWSARFVNGSTAAISDGSGQVTLWNTVSGETKAFQINNGDANMVQLTVSADRQFLGVTCGHWPHQPKPAKVVLINLEKEQLEFECVLPRGLYYSVSSFSQDGRYLAICCYRHVVIMDVPAQTIAREIPFDVGVKHVAFSPDGNWLACSMVDGELQMLDTTSFRREYTIRTHRLYSGDVSFSPDSRRFAVVGMDNQIKLFDTLTGGAVGGEFTKCETYPATVAFSPDGQRLVTGAMDGKVRIWHVESGEELLSFDVPKSWYPSCDFADDGNLLVVGCGPLARAYRAADRNDLQPLTLAELDDISCANYVFRSEPWD